MNKRISSFFCDPKTVIKNVAIFLLMIFLSVYAFFQILPTFAQKIETETALPVSVYDTTQTTGYIFREEQLVSGPSNGIAVTLVKDGERLSNGQHFANVYSNADAAKLQEEINAIDRKIETLSKSVVDTDLYVTDITKTDEAISDNFDELFSKIAKNDLTDTLNIQKDLLVNLNKKDMIVNMTDSYDAEIASLQTQRNAILNRINSMTQKLIAPFSGYYYGDTDGYETIFDPAELENLTIERFHEIISQPPLQNSTTADFGKIVTDFVWYVVCETDRLSAAKYNIGSYYKLRFTSFSEEEIKLELTDVISETSEDTALLIFRGNTAPEGFPYQRSQQVDIISDGYSGLAVSKQALRVVDGKTGVYILDGDIVRFRLADVIFEDEDYYVISTESAKTADNQEDTEDGKTYYYLTLYDNVIVSGKSLFDGKIIG